jgi:dihydrofolate synthase/folylpolyglutamate synthase
VLLGEQESEADEALAGAAAAAGAPLRRVGERVELAAVESRGWQGQSVELALAGRRLTAPIRLPGVHQAANLALAAAAAVELRALGFSRFDLDVVARGAAECRWPGRLEAVDLPAGRRVVLDGAHNPAGIAALAAFVRRMGEPVDLLFGALADKDAAAMLPPLLGLSRNVTLTAPPSPRALDPRDLALLAPGRRVELESEPRAALARAIERGGGERALLVCGSLYLIGELRGELRRRYGVPADLRTI